MTNDVRRFFVAPQWLMPEQSGRAQSIFRAQRPVIPG